MRTENEGDNNKVMTTIVSPTEEYLENFEIQRWVVACLCKSTYLPKKSDIHSRSGTKVGLQWNYSRTNENSSLTASVWHFFVLKSKDEENRWRLRIFESKGER